MTDGAGAVGDDGPVDDPLGPERRAQLRAEGLRRQRLRAGVAATLPVLPVLGVLVYVVVTAVRGEDTAWIFAAVLVVILILTLGFGWWLYRQVGRNTRWAPEPALVAGADRVTRRRIMRLVRRGRLPEEQPDRVLALDLARTIDRHRPPRWVVVGLALGLVAQLLISDGFLRWFWIVYIVAVVPVVVITWRYYRRIRELVERTREEPSAE